MKMFELIFSGKLELKDQSSVKSSEFRQLMQLKKKAVDTCALINSASAVGL